MAAGTAQPGTVQVVISSSGSTIDAVRVAELARSKGAFVIGISNRSKSPLIAVCDLALIASWPETPLTGGAFPSKISQLLIVDALVAEMTRQDPKRLVELSRTAEVMTAASDLPVLAIDIGGTKIVTAEVSGGRITHRRQAPTPRTGMGEDLVVAIAELAPKSGFGAVAVATTAIVRDGALTALNPETLPIEDGYPIASMIESAFGMPPTIVNDAQAAAWPNSRSAPAPDFATSPSSPLLSGSGEADPTADIVRFTDIQSVCPWQRSASDSKTGTSRQSA
ncbi:ROK family protein [Mesorhizobium sp. WSM4976]|uniref:ROK family protein n=1 Tax=Mesorhizobium sp. WSM4976 TaxID=3038549 RepID=UPI002417B462|nr:ROK family protein [Mesorhizobium sp. WSM4976]MDG4898800.1 ROK family protein [Mesorhizobium sp. WSM4976]